MINQQLGCVIIYIRSVHACMEIGESSEARDCNRCHPATSSIRTSSPHIAEPFIVEYFLRISIVFMDGSWPAWLRPHTQCVSTGPFYIDCNELWAVRTLLGLNNLGWKSWGADDIHVTLTPLQPHIYLSLF